LLFLNFWEIVKIKFLPRGGGLDRFDKNMKMDSVGTICSAWKILFIFPIPQISPEVSAEAFLRQMNAARIRDNHDPAFFNTVCGVIQAGG